MSLFRYTPETDKTKALDSLATNLVMSLVFLSPPGQMATCKSGRKEYKAALTRGI